MFGTLKQWGRGEFLMRGLEEARGECSLSALAYNLRRVLKLKSMGKLLGALPTTTYEVRTPRTSQHVQ